MIANSMYHVKIEELENKTMSLTRYGVEWVHSVAGFQFKLERRRTPIVINTYLPCMMLLLISFIGFFIPVQMIPGRMALLVTIFLMLVNISSSEKAHGPNVIAVQYNHRQILKSNNFSDSDNDSPRCMVATGQDYPLS